MSALRGRRTVAMKTFRSSRTRVDELHLIFETVGTFQCEA